MTEFQRALAAVEAIEGLVAKLAGSLRSRGGISVPGDAGSTDLGVACLFDPPSRREPSSTGDDWLVVGQMSAFEAQVSEEQRAQFAETARLLEDLAPTAERMRRRCMARADLEAIKAQLRERVPKALADPVEAAQAMVASRESGFEVVAPLLEKVSELERAATYGARMAEQVTDLLTRFDAARALYDTDVLPRLSVAVAAAAADDAERRRAAIGAAEAEAEAERKRSQEKARRAVEELVAASEARLRQARCEDEERRRAAQAAAAAALRAPRRCGGGGTGLAAACARAFS